MPEFFKDMNESVDRYNRRAEAHEEKWKKDHDEAVKCLEVEETVAFGLTVYNLLNRLDEIWRLNVHKKKVKHDRKIDKAITKGYRAWLVGSKRLIKVIAKFEGLSYDVTGAEEFRVAVREVEGILADDGDFFVGEKFVELAAAAAKSHASGETKELRRITD